MLVQDLMNMLGKIDPHKSIDIVVNLGNPEDENEDFSCNNLEFWDNGEETAVLFISNHGERK